MAPHLIWAGVVLVVAVLIVRQIRWQSNLSIVTQNTMVRFQSELGETRRDVLALNERLKAVEQRQSKDAIWSGDSFAKLEGRLRELEPVVKQLASVPKAQPLGRRV